MKEIAPVISTALLLAPLALTVRDDFGMTITDDGFDILAFRDGLWKFIERICGSGAISSPTDHIRPPVNFMTLVVI